MEIIITSFVFLTTMVKLLVFYFLDCFLQYIFPKKQSIVLSQTMFLGNEYFDLIVLRIILQNK